MNTELRHRSALLLATAATVVGLAGCANGVNLKPAPSTAQGNGQADNKVVNTVDNVTMTVKVNTWSGDSQVLKDVTPLRLKVQNDSAAPIQISYENFALVADNGQRYSALPPFKIEGSVNRRVTTHVGNPGFGYSNFGVSPAYGGAYNGVSTYGGGVGYNSFGYNNAYYNRWKTINVELPTDHMRQVAVPDGVVGPGGLVDGFLFFEKVPTSMIGRVHFRADLINADTGERLGEISIPFVTPRNNG